MNFKDFYLKENDEIRLWLDDLRNPKDYNEINVTWITTAEEAIDLIKTGKVVWISFDHDLGTEKTGYDVAKFIEEAVFNKEIKVPEWKIHSANPTGRKNIEMAMKSAERFFNR